MTGNDVDASAQAAQSNASLSELEQRVRRLEQALLVVLDDSNDRERTLRQFLEHAVESPASTPQRKVASYEAPNEAGSEGIGNHGASTAHAEYVREQAPPLPPRAETGVEMSRTANKSATTPTGAPRSEQPDSSHSEARSESARSAPPPPPPPPRDWGPAITKAPWLLFEIWRDLKCMVAMFFDMRFQVAWTTRMFALIVVPIILLGNWIIPFASLPVLGDVIVNAVNLVLAFVLFKWLGRDARRYAAWKADL